MKNSLKYMDSLFTGCSSFSSFFPTHHRLPTPSVIFLSIKSLVSNSSLKLGSFQIQAFRVVEYLASLHILDKNWYLNPLKCKVKSRNLDTAKQVEIHFELLIHLKTLCTWKYTWFSCFRWLDGWNQKVKSPLFLFT